MEIYIDLRCLQDPGYAFRGVGYHSSTLLREGRRYYPTGSHWVGIIDPQKSAIPDEYGDLVDTFTSVWAPNSSEGKNLFIQLSPMTHDAGPVHRFLGHSSTLTASIIYDFIPLDLSERYLSGKKSEADYALRLSWIRQYDLMFPISEYSAARLLDLVDTDRRCVHVTGVALRREFESILLGERKNPFEFSTARKPYYLFVGGADPRKNVNVVLESHALLSVAAKPRLVIVGAYPQRFYDEMIAFYLSLGGNPKDIELHRGIGDAELAALYRDCLCTICSSEMEGFSLPVIEAIACGSCVFVSDIDAHRELVSVEETIFEPHDSTRLRQMMQRALVEPEWTRGLAVAQKPIAKRFILERVAYRFWNPIVQSQKVFSEKRSRKSDRPIRTRIAFLSPFPPDRTGVADYTRRSLEEIGKLADIDVFCETNNPKETSGVRNFLPLSTLPYLSGEYDHVVSVIGNSHFHTKIIDYQVKFGGPCLVHDNRLAELYNWWKGPDAFHAMACRSLGRNVSYQECQDWIHDPGKLQSIYFDDLIPGARPLMVHSKGIQAQVKKQYGTDAVCLPFCVYRDFPDELLSKKSKQYARKKLGIDSGIVAIVTLGIVDPTKSPQTCIEAVSQVRQSGINAHLYFVGSSSGRQSSIDDFAKRMNVGDAVHRCSDWVDEQMYIDFVVAADMAIQLRSHFLGGLSGALLDCIAAGLVTFANDDLAQSMDAPASVLRISDRLCPDELSKQILTAIAGIDLNDRLTDDCRKYRFEHSFAIYARRFVDCL